MLSAVCIRIAHAILLQRLLIVPELSVCSVLRDKFFMRAFFRNGACVQHIDAVRLRYIRQTMRDQNDGSGLRQLMNQCHYLILALHIDVGCSLVEEINRRIMQQSSRERQTLSLSAGQVGAILLQLGLQAVLGTKEIRQIYFRKNLPQLLLVRIRLRDPQVVADASPELSWLTSVRFSIRLFSLIPDISCPPIRMEPE